MAVVEQIPNSETSPCMPTPGSYQHLEWITDVEAALIDNHEQLDSFLAETNITRTLGMFTKRLRIFRPIKTHTVEIDTRMFNGRETWIPVLHSSYTRNPSSPYTSLLTMHGQPQPWAEGEGNFTYDISLPIHLDFSYDPSRPAQASIRTDVDSPSPRRAIYNQAAFPEYSEDNPGIMIMALNVAARDMANFARYYYGVDRIPAYAQDERTAKVDRVAQSLGHLLK
jgi:hypothetical protein